MDSVDIILGEEKDIQQLFSATNPDIELTDVVTHAFNQTLQRDMFFGAWADAYLHKPDGLYHVKLTSPNKDLSHYKVTIPALISAGKIAMDIFNAGKMTTSKMKFYLPFGLAMSDFKSIQMLHFPPSEALDFTDYLYNPTCRRWELLLLHNGFDSKQNTLLERLIDLVPIAAPGDDSKDIDKHNTAFYDYIIMLFEMFLGSNASAEGTAPAVVGGAPAIDCIATTYKDQLKGCDKLEPMSLVELEIVNGKKTNLLCTNHPSTYLFFAYGSGDGPAHQKKAMEIMRQDLICAGWQAKMAENWDDDPKQVLSEMKERWYSDEKVKQIMKDSYPEWSFSS